MKGRSARTGAALAALLMGSSAACTTAVSNMSQAATPAQLPGYAQSYDRVFGAAVDAVAMLSWEVTVTQKDAGIISAKTPESLTTFGDKITVHVFRPGSTRGDTLVRVGFTSGTDQKFDWGKNGRNRDRFYEKLNGIVTAPTSSAQR